MGDRYVLGFAPTLIFLLSQILRRLYESPWDESVKNNKEVPCVQTLGEDHIRVSDIL